MESELETFEALDLSLPKTKSVDDTLSGEEAPYSRHPPSGCAKSDDILPSVRESSVSAFPEIVLHKQGECSDHMENNDMKNKDLEPPTKRCKLSFTPHEGDSLPAAFVSRDADVDDACLRDDHGSPPSVPFHTENNHGVEELKRTCDGVSVSLHDEKLWRAFSDLGTEMIINRSGRRMFPHIIISVRGLHPRMMYSVSLEIVPADHQRYKYIHNQWVPTGMTDPGPGVQSVFHPDSPNVGAFWMRNNASYSKVRLTNNKETSLKESADGNILLHSMHKYKVVIKIKEVNLPSPRELSFDFDESAFFAVTAYQNSKITQLKIQNNPFAKAFRDCHHLSATQKTMTPRRRDPRMKNEFMTQLAVPNVPAQTKEFPSLHQYQSMPFQRGGFNIAAALEHLYRNNMVMNSPSPSQYYPWATVGQHWPYQFFVRDPSLMNAVYSSMRSSKHTDPACRDRRRCSSANSGSSSSGSYQDTEDSSEEMKN